MTLNEFKDWALAQGSVDKYNDGQYKGECVSLINQYCYRVLDVPADAWGHAKDWATNAAPLQYFDKVNDLKAGDVLVYGGTANNPYGHIEIYLGNSQSLGQNRHLDGRARVEPILNNYTAILRSKGQGGGMPTLVTPEIGKILFIEMLGRNPDDPNAFADLPSHVGKPLDQEIQELWASQERHEFKVRQAKQRENWEAQADSLEKQINKLSSMGGNSAEAKAALDLINALRAALKE